MGSADLQLASALLELWDFFFKMPAKASSLWVSEGGAGGVVGGY